MRTKIKKVVYRLGVRKHFGPWEQILLPESYFGLKVLIHFWMKIV